MNKSLLSRNQCKLKYWLALSSNKKLPADITLNIELACQEYHKLLVHQWQKQDIQDDFKSKLSNLERKLRAYTNQAYLR